MYRRASTIADVIAEVAANSVIDFGRMWKVVMGRQEVKAAFSAAGLNAYSDEADVRDTEVVDRIRDVAQWAKSHCRHTHGRQVYETISTLVADPTEKKDGGTCGWVMRRLGIGAAAMQSGMTRRKVLNESYFREGVVFNDDRSDFKTKNDQFSEQAALQQLFWVEDLAPTRATTSISAWGRRRPRAERPMSILRRWRRARR